VPPEMTNAASKSSHAVWGGAWAQSPGHLSRHVQFPETPEALCERAAQQQWLSRALLTPRALARAMKSWAASVVGSTVFYSNSIRKLFLNIHGVNTFFN